MHSSSLQLSLLSHRYRSLACLTLLMSTLTLCAGCMKVDENLNTETHSPTAYVDSIRKFSVAKEKYLDCVQSAWQLKFDAKDVDAKAKFEEAAAIVQELDLLRKEIAKNNPGTMKQNQEAAQREVDRLNGIVKEFESKLEYAINSKDLPQFKMAASTHRGFLGNRIDAENQLAATK